MFLWEFLSVCVWVIFLIFVKWEQWMMVFCQDGISDQIKSCRLSSIVRIFLSKCFLMLLRICWLLQIYKILQGFSHVSQWFPTKTSFLTSKPSWGPSNPSFLPTSPKRCVQPLPLFYNNKVNNYKLSCGKEKKEQVENHWCSPSLLASGWNFYL